MKSRAAKVSRKKPVATAPVKNSDGVPLARVRRVPNPWAFLLTGAVVGIVLGLVLAHGGGDGSYEDGSASAYFMVLFGALGALLGGLVFAVLDRRS